MSIPVKVPSAVRIAATTWGKQVKDGDLVHVHCPQCNLELNQVHGVLDHGNSGPLACRFSFMKALQSASEATKNPEEMVDLDQIPGWVTKTEPEIERIEPASPAPKKVAALSDEAERAQRATVKKLEEEKAAVNQLKAELAAKELSLKKELGEALLTHKVVSQDAPPSNLKMELPEVKAARVCFKCGFVHKDLGVCEGSKYLETSKMKKCKYCGIEQPDHIAAKCQLKERATQTVAPVVHNGVVHEKVVNKVDKPMTKERRESKDKSRNGSPELCYLFSDMLDHLLWFRGLKEVKDIDEMRSTLKEMESRKIEVKRILKELHEAPGEQKLKQRGELLAWLDSKAKVL